MNSRNHIVKVNEPKSARLLEKKMSSRFGSFHDSNEIFNVSLTNVGGFFRRTHHRCTTQILNEARGGIRTVRLTVQLKFKQKSFVFLPTMVIG